MIIINTIKNIDVSNLTNYLNSNDLDKLYFTPKKVSKDLIYEKNNSYNYITKVKKTLSFIEKYDLEDEVKSIFRLFENDTGYKLNDEKIYLVIGLDTTTIYSTNIDGNDVTVLCLEAIEEDINKLKMLLAHEFTHFIRKKLLNKDIFEECIGERLITEGIAANYSEEIVPNKSEAYYCIVPDSTVNWVNNNIKYLDNIICDNLDDKKYMAMLFYMYAKIEIKNMPVRCGYVYGYLKVKNYLISKNLKVKDIIGINWDEIL